jgi:branched-subunit amino acid ABC-type transport system permease component
VGVEFPLAFGIVLSSVVASTAAVLIERIAYAHCKWPAHPADHLIGMSFFVQYGSGPPGASRFRPTSSPKVVRDRILFGRSRNSIPVVVVVLSMVGLWMFVNRSKTGHIRGRIKTRRSPLMGIDVTRWW